MKPNAFIEKHVHGLAPSAAFHAKREILGDTMKVGTWFGSNTYGVRVGIGNRQKFFSETWSEIEVEMDGRFEEFKLTNGFWNKCPEFRDPSQSRIKEWLRKHRTLNWEPGKPPQMTLMPLGGNRFRLEP